MDLNHVTTFLRVVENDSFTAAAAALGLPKSSVSRNVAHLEEDLGVRLLQRSTRRIGLTEAGKAFYERARAALTGLEEASVAASDLGREPRGTIRVTAPADAGALVLADLVARFVRRYPLIHVELSLTARMVDLVEEGFDLALRAAVRLDDSALLVRRIGSMESGLFAAPGYLRRRGPLASLAELSQHDCVLFRSRGANATWRLSGPPEGSSGDGESAEARVEHAIAVQGPIAADDISFVMAAVRAGAGIGLLPAFLCVEQVLRGKLVRLLPAYASHEASLHLVMPSGRYVPARVALLRDYLLKHLGELTLTCPKHIEGLSLPLFKDKDPAAPKRTGARATTEAGAGAEADAEADAEIDADEPETDPGAAINQVLTRAREKRRALAGTRRRRA